MLTWMGIVGKLIELILTKVAGNKVDLFLNNKRYAAKAFVRFHEAVITLEEMLDAFLKEMEILSKDTEFRISYIENRSYLTDLAGAAREFVDSMEQLGNVLYFYDKDLASQLTLALRSKTTVLYNIHSLFAEAAQRETKREYERTKLRTTRRIKSQTDVDLPIINFEVENQGIFNNIKYAIPSESLMNNFDKYFTKVSSSYSTAKSDNYNNIRNYQSTVLDIIKNNVEHGYILNNERVKAIEFCANLKEHKEVLTVAREQLREFIKEKFTLEEVLSVI